MQIKKGFKLRRLGREYIILAEGLEQVNFNKMISLNETAKFLWDSLEGKDFTVEDITSLLLEKYEVDAETASADAARLAQSWIDAELVEA